jgi:hypothetical protein
MSTSLQTTLGADAHLPQGQLLHEQTLNHAKSRTYWTGIQRPTISKTRAEFQTKVNLSKNESIEAMPLIHKEYAILIPPEQENNSNGL